MPLTVVLLILLIHASISSANIALFTNISSINKTETLNKIKSLELKYYEFIYDSSPGIHSLLLSYHVCMKINMDIIMITR